ncbi:DUF932 domain-containing protein [Streptomyces sp. 110]|uniref:DUF932 domain-containing protein n=1 Tax=Streptomyces endocoffeicus TaxID=2898945 RepID=A0ABS1Q6K5_9ACTN|nr:DUF932 domain-containing protein [Streptomyces endocoffeicus]MBL1120297.1 DUF932 domain-containing protein [Streptomyces endocoffeicus]
MTQQVTESPVTRTPRTSTRNADLSDLAHMLEVQNGRKLDVVAPASSLTVANGNLIMSRVEPAMTDHGRMFMSDGTYRPTDVAEEGFAAKLGIPVGYLRRMRTENPALYDINVCGWLEQDPSRKFLIRAFRGDAAENGHSGEGVARAFLSDSYRLIDNFDILTAALQGVEASGHRVEIKGCDLTDRRMYVRVESDQVAIQARELLRGYRSPFTGETGDQLPMVSAGFVISNSEVGSGAFSITPRAVVQVCRNGLTMSKDVMRAVHIGAKHDEGIVQWSGATRARELELVASKTADAVQQFLSPAYVEAKIDEIEREAGKQISDPAQTIEMVSKQLSFSGAVRESILNHFIRGGQTTAGGVMQAVTSTAQTLSDADAAHELEAMALPALAAAARAA